MPVILAIESSCDETAAAVCRDGHILSNLIATQEIHKQYGGVVPELASRAHMQQIVPVVQQALQKAGVGVQDIDAIGFTRAPGLIGSLLVGAQFAKSMALALDLPLLAIHHMQAHVLANLIDEPRPAFPFLCLTVSGGHTQIVVCHDPLSLDIIGQTIDDAAGEAFDKTAKMLGLPYPGGPLIDQWAAQGNPHAFVFPTPKVPGLDFSFSGLKTSVLYFLQNAGASMLYREKLQVTEPERKAFIEKNMANICASVQHRIVDILMQKLEMAAEKTGIKRVCLAGGVSANRGLRRAFEEKGLELGWQTFIPAFEYCTDNAAMIALTAYYKYQSGVFDGLDVGASAKSGW